MSQKRKISTLFEVDSPAPFDTMGLFTFLRTYARRHDEDNPSGTVETWQECLDRVITACDSQLHVDFTEAEKKELFELMFNLKCSVAGRFLWQLGTKTVDRLGLPSLQNCFRQDTEFWTSDGIRSFKNFKDGDIVNIRGKSKWLPATIKNFGPQKLVKLVVRYMTAYREIFTTANHRWIVKTKIGDGIYNWKQIETTSLQKGQKLAMFVKKTNFHAINMCPVGIQHGIVFGDGNMRGNVDNCAITLCGEKKELSSFFFTSRKNNREITGLPNTWKTLPSINMNKEYLYGFLAGWCATDGNVSGCQLTLSNKNKEVLEWARGAFAKIDISSGPVVMMREVSPFDGTEKPCYRVAIYTYNIPKEFFIRSAHAEKFVAPKQKMEWRVESVEETNIVEDVWCVTEPKEECFTLADGILTKNCSFVVIDEPVRPFTWTMNFLMLGAGVGYRLLPEDIAKLPEVQYALITRKDTKDADYVVPDSREGWVKLLGKVLKAHFYSGQNFTYSCTLLRSKGAPIKSFGGVASGPDVLCDGIEKISSVLNKRAGQKLRPVDALDIMNIIGMIVVSGNVRRSAQIALGSVHDKEFLKAKRWDLGNIPNWRAFSNNSVICNDFNEVLDNEDFWKGYDGTGEPYGLINLRLARSCGRLGETMYPDPELEGFNPCLTGDTMILTSEGLKTITDLVDKKFTAVVNGEEHSSTEKGFWKTGTKSVMRIKLKNGMEIKATDNHKFAVSLSDGNYEWEEVKNLKVHDFLVLCNNKGYKNQKDCKFLQNLFDKHGFVRNFCIHLSGENIDYQKVQKMLYGLGIESYLEGSELVIIDENSLLLFEDIVGFSDIYEGSNLQHLNSNNREKSKSVCFREQIISIEKAGEEDVYDCTIPTVHCFSANGILSHNCSEQGLGNKETCCLGEIFLPNIKSEEELLTCATYIYRICKHSLTLPCVDSKETEQIVHRNMRMGIGVSGYLQATDLQRSWLNNCYKHLRVFDKEYSRMHGFPPSIKLATVKPSGTLSILANCTPGVHPGFARYYKRRVRIASESQLIPLARQHGYPVEYVRNFDGSIDHTTQIITFPMRLPESTVLAENCTAIDQLEWVKKVQTEWSDNSVSVTVYYRKHELPAIKEWLKKNYNTSVKTVSFLLHSDHGFLQAPMEQIDKTEYESLAKQCRPIVDLSGICYSMEDSDVLLNEKECGSGACPRK